MEQAVEVTRGRNVDSWLLPKLLCPLKEVKVTAGIYKFAMVRHQGRTAGDRLGPNETPRSCIPSRHSEIRRSEKKDRRSGPGTIVPHESCNDDHGSGQNLRQSFPDN